MDSSSGDRDPVELLADEFLERRRRGEEPTMQEYVDKYPQWEVEIRDTFPALELMERADPGTVSLAACSADTVADTQFAWPKEIADYRILREIGRGAMGIVYEAEQQSLARRVALKTLPRTVSVNEKAISRFRTEARAAARLHHTNIVPVFEVGQDGDTAFYAMQLIRGCSLDEVVDELRQLREKGVEKDHKWAPNPEARSVALSLYEGPLLNAAHVDSDSSEHRTRNDGHERDASGTPNVSDSSLELILQNDSRSFDSQSAAYFDNVARIGQQIASALHYAHERKTIHRDIKPSNLLLDSEGVVWVADFGLAKFEEDEHTRTGDIVGTLRYMSPERFQGKCDIRSDIYSLGVTLYELLLLRPPFDSTDQLKLIDDISKGNPVRPRSVDPRIPRDLETIVLKGMEKDPSRRYQSAEDMAEDLDRFVADEPIRARRVSSAERLVRWTRHNKLVATLAASIFLLLTVSALVADNLRREAVSSLEKEQTQSYVYGISAAFLAWQDADMESLIRLLRELVPATGQKDLRGFEWYYLRRLVQDSLGTNVRRYTAPIRAVALTPNGDALVVVLENGEVHLKRPDDGQPRLFLGPEYEPRTWRATGPACFFNDGDHLAIAVAQTENESTPVSGQVLVFDTVSGEVLGAMEHPREVSAVAVASNGSYGVSIDKRGNAKIWNARNIKQIDTFDLSGYSTRVAAHKVAISSDGKLIAAGVRHRLQIRKIDSDGPPTELELDSVLRGICFAPDGNLLAIGTYNDMQLVDVNRPKDAPIWKLAEESDLLTFSEDGKLLVIGGTSDFVTIWRIIERERVHRFFHRANVTGMAVSFAKGLLISGSEDGELKTWNLKDCVDSESFRGDVRGHIALDVSLDGAQFATGFENESVKVVTLSDGSELVLNGHKWPLLSASFSNNGDLLLSTSDGVRVWDLTHESKEKIEESCFVFTGHKGSVADAIFLRDDATVVSISTERELFVWESGSGKILHRLTSKTDDFGRSCLDLSPDGRLLAVGGNKGIELWDMSAPTPCLIDSREEENGVRSVAFSPNGDCLAFGGSGGYARIWELATGKIVLDIHGASNVSCVAFTPDQQTLAIQAGRMVMLVHVATGHILGRLRFEDLMEKIVFSPVCGHRTLITASEMGDVRVWRAAQEQGVTGLDSSW